jgi:transcriptional regulator with GAF, ATPase, and Fis domain
LDTQALIHKARAETKEAYKEKNELQNVMEEYTKTIEKMIGRKEGKQQKQNNIDAIANTSAL